MADSTLFYFIFSRFRQITPGGACHTIGLTRAIVAKIVGGLDLCDTKPEDWVTGCKAELADHIMCDPEDLTAELCFGACVSTLLLMRALGTIDLAMEHAGLVVWFDGEPSDQLLPTDQVNLRVEGLTQPQVDELRDAMIALGADHRDLAAELRVAVSAELRRRKGATVH